MKVALFARVDPTLNPYILLFKKALELQGLTVNHERELGLGWLLTKGKSFSVIHLHWIEAAYKPAALNSKLGQTRLVSNRVVKPFRGFFRLVNFSLALFLAKLQGKVIVYTVHNLETHHKQDWPFIILSRIANYIVFSLADHIHVHNQYARQTLETTHERKEGIVLIPHGNYKGCYSNQISQSEARRQLRLPQDAVVYLSLGQLRPYKGIENLINSFIQLDLSTGWLLIAGQTTSDAYQKKLLGLTQDHLTIKLVPEFIPDDALQIYTNACNIFVLPYLTLTTSGAALLALSFGRPIIVPNIASFPELVTPKIGMLYDPSQPNALTLALQRASQCAWSEREILDYVEQFNWDRLGPSLANLYNINSTNHST